MIPAHNEATLLPRLLDTVETARARYRYGSEAIEVIVADNASTDTTAAIARSRGCRVVFVERRVISASRNGGAAVASGPILCFVDADNRIHPETFNEIERVMTTGRVIAGATGARPERWSAGIAVSWWLVLTPIMLVTRMDTGVTFCGRDDFAAIGGYNEQLLLAEDVQLLLDLKRRGRASGRRLARMRGVQVIWSMRKFDKWGDWHYLTIFWRFLPVIVPAFVRSFMGRADPRDLTAMRTFAQEYWYDDRTTPAP